MASKKSASGGAVAAVLAGARLVYDVVRPAACPNCGKNTYVFICLSCPRVVANPQRR